MQLPSRIFGSLRGPAIKKRLIEWGSIALLVALIVIPLGTLAWLAFFTNTFHVQAITVVDSREHTAAAIQDLTTSAKGRNILFLQTPILEQRILSSVPQVRDIYITRKLPNTLRVVVQEKTPAFLLLSNGMYFFVDAQGIAYEQAELGTLPGTILPIIKNNDQTASLQIGQPAVETSFVEFIIQAQEDIPAVTEADIVEMRIPSLSAREVHVLLNNNWIIRFDTTRHLSLQVNVLQRLLAHTITEEEKEYIEYVDLRISNRVYYKLRDNAPVSDR
ncbi:MAG: FtsQ-type POTRA domain-containing protein [Candidatus Andersenbacteria bacterium]